MLFTSWLKRPRQKCSGCHPEPATEGEGSAFRAHAKEEADSSGKLRPRNDNLNISLVAPISSSGATALAQVRAAPVPDATLAPALRDAPRAAACWRDGSAEDARRNRHPSP